LIQIQEKKVKGFTILELIVVLTIIATITAIGFQPFQKWRSDRKVRNEALKISSLIKDIYSQVQRGHYAFVQFSVDEDSIVTNGMGMEKFTIKVRNKYDVDGNPTEFHNFGTRCSSDLEWDDEGISSNKLTVNNMEISEDIVLSVPGSSDSDVEGAVCFSKDGSYYSASGAFLTRSGESETAIEEIYISDGSEENLFSVKWTRFGNITLYKYFDEEFVPQ